MIPPDQTITLDRLGTIKVVQAVNDSGKLKTKIGMKYDYPFVMQNFTHERWHASLEYFGVAQRYLRPPDKSYTDEQMKEVRKFWDDLGVRPQDNK